MCVLAGSARKYLKISGSLVEIIEISRECIYYYLQRTTCYSVLRTSIAILFRRNYVHHLQRSRLTLIDTESYSWVWTIYSLETSTVGVWFWCGKLRLFQTSSSWCPVNISCRRYRRNSTWTRLSSYDDQRYRWGKCVCPSKMLENISLILMHVSMLVYENKPPTLTEFFSFHNEDTFYQQVGKQIERSKTELQLNKNGGVIRSATEDEALPNLVPRSPRKRILYLVHPLPIAWHPDSDACTTTCAGIIFCPKWMAIKRATHCEQFPQIRKERKTTKTKLHLQLFPDPQSLKFVAIVHMRPSPKQTKEN